MNTNHSLPYKSGMSYRGLCDFHYDEFQKFNPSTEQQFDGMKFFVKTDFIGKFEQNILPHLKNKFKSITNFGTRPTIDNSTKEIFETHILNFNQDIYNKKITVELTDFIREEKKFYNIDELKKQISEDIAKINL